MNQRVSAPTQHTKLLAWVEKVAALTQPDTIYWCDGSAAENERLCQLLIDNGAPVEYGEPLAIIE